MEMETCDEKAVAEFADEEHKLKRDEEQDDHEDDEYNQPFELDQ